MKKIYVLNLDKRRIYIVAGSLLILLGTTFVLGMRHSSYSSQVALSDSKESSEMYSLEEVVARSAAEHDSNLTRSDNMKTNHPLDNLPLDNNTVGHQKPILPPLSTESSLSVQEDPMISRPPKHKRTKTRKPATKTVQRSSNISSSAKYTIQVGAFVHEKDAIRLKNKLQKADIEARVERGIRFWFVRSGRSSDKSSLEAARQKIAGLDLKPMIKKTS